MKKRSGYFLPLIIFMILCFLFSDQILARPGEMGAHFPSGNEFYNIRDDSRNELKDDFDDSRNMDSEKDIKTDDSDENRSFIAPPVQSKEQMLYDSNHFIYQDPQSINYSLPKLDSGNFVYKNSNGGTLASIKAQEAYPFSENYALIKQDDKYGFIDTNGNIAISPKYDYASSFSNGLAAVSVNGKYGFIKTNGDFAIKPEYDYASPFSYGLSCVRINNLYGYIGLNSNMIIQPKYSNAFSFNNVYFENNQLQLARVYYNNQWNYIDQTGRYYFNANPPLYYLNPGIGFGAWGLNGNFNTYLNRLGNQYVYTDNGMLCKYSYGYPYYTDFSVLKDGNSLYTISSSNIYGCLKNGIGIGTSKDFIIKSYGNCSRLIWINQSAYQMFYDNLGLYFLMNDIDNVIEMGVYQGF